MAAVIDRQHHHRRLPSPTTPLYPLPLSHRLVACAAIGTVTATVLAALPSPLAHTITAVRDRASSAVHEATGVFHTVAHPLTGAASSITHGITGSVVDAAASIAATGVDFALRQAALIDSSLKLTDKAVSIDHEWHITDKAKAGLTTGLGLAQSVDQRLGLVQTAQGMDARILGGRGTGEGPRLLLLMMRLTVVMVDRWANSVLLLRTLRLLPVAPFSIRAPFHHHHHQHHRPNATLRR